MLRSVANCAARKNAPTQRKPLATAASKLAPDGYDVRAAPVVGLITAGCRARSCFGHPISSHLSVDRQSASNRDAPHKQNAVPSARLFMWNCLPTEMRQANNDFAGSRSLELSFRADCHLCPLPVAGSIARRDLCDQIPINNQRIESRCVECPDRIER